jgi:hypothetical protein
MATHAFTRLGDFFRQMRIAHLTKGDGINQIDVPRYQSGKRLLGITLGVFPQQRQVIDDHLACISTPG